MRAERADFSGGRLVVMLRDADRQEVFKDIVVIPEIKNGESYKVDF